MLRCKVCLAALSKTLMQQQYSFSQKYVRVRMRRFFDGQFKHVYIGKVISETPNCLILFARSFHFRKILSNGSVAGQKVSESSGLSTEDICERAIPWASIEFAQIIEDPINFEVPAIWGSCGKIVLDNKHKTFITSTHDHGE